ncbi:YceI family protein [Amycolatopsis taiwanensis]|uniref:YceI family protein n=1 Tax=Amycolatopsis taiwanensis TaxID=342230 RepID=UPI00048538AD|nr:YceI family protein [Amycolatopsis taiwanensis]
MALQDGTYRIGPDVGRLLVHTGRTGLGSKAGHDLTLGATSWSGTVVVDTGDPARSSVTIDVRVASLHVVSGSGGVKPLTDSDRADIERIMRDKVLDAARHPTITFRSTRVSGTLESFTVDGEATIMGTPRPVTASGSADADGRVRARATVPQSRWGIKPYSAFFGALKVADDVVIEVEVALEAPSP